MNVDFYNTNTGRILRKKKQTAVPREGDVVCIYGDCLKVFGVTWHYYENGQEDTVNVFCRQ